MLANLLRIDQIPLAYIPPEPYQQLRELMEPSMLRLLVVGGVVLLWFWRR